MKKVEPNMTVKNADRFLTVFNRIDHRMRHMVGAKDTMPFSRLIDQAKKKSLLVRKYEDDLRAYADLRNDIVHHRTAMEFVIYQFISRYITI